MDPFRTAGAPTMPCPRCTRVGLGSRHVLDAVIDECADCGGAFVPAPVYAGPLLVPGQTVIGPAIVEEPFTTVVVYPRQRATVDQHGNYHLIVGS